MADIQEQILAELVRIRETIEAQAIHLGCDTQTGKRFTGPQPRAIANDADLNSKYGDPEIRFTPHGWEGKNYKGCKMSQCPPDFLDLLAVAFDVFAERETDEKKRGWKLKDASLARGWARRIRGETPADQPPPDSDLNVY